MRSRNALVYFNADPSTVRFVTRFVCVIGAVNAGACGTGEDPPTIGTDVDPGADCEAIAVDCPVESSERPPRLSEHAAVYAKDWGRLIIVGGSTATPEACEIPEARYSTDTWIFEDACGTWRRAAGSGPGPRSRSSAAYGEGRVWVFGGRYREPGLGGPYTVYAELLAFDVARETWTPMTQTEPRPPPRSDSAMVWDDRRGVLWLFGGNTSAEGLVYEPIGDLWSFDPSTGAWTEHSTFDTPSARLQHALLHDAARDRLVVFGGSDESAFADNARYSRALVALDLASLTWQPLAESTQAPTGRFWSRLVHDTRRDVYVLFGGHDDQSLGNRNDTWVYDPTDGTWELETAGDTLSNPATEFCAPPYDFAEVDGAVPERRSSHAFVWSEPCGHALLFGGKTDCGAVDDVWSYKGGRWTERLAATEGEACWRAEGRPDTCLGLCQ